MPHHAGWKMEAAEKRSAFSSAGWSSVWITKYDAHAELKLCKLLIRDSAEFSAAPHPCWYTPVCRNIFTMLQRWPLFSANAGIREPYIIHELVGETGFITIKVNYTVDQWRSLGITGLLQGHIFFLLVLEFQLRSRVSGPNYLTTTLKPLSIKRIKYQIQLAYFNVEIKLVLHKFSRLYTLWN